MGVEKATEGSFTALPTSSPNETIKTASKNGHTTSEIGPKSLLKALCDKISSLFQSNASKVEAKSSENTFKASLIGEKLSSIVSKIKSFFGEEKAFDYQTLDRERFQKEFTDKMAAEGPNAKASPGKMPDGSTLLMEALYYGAHEEALQMIEQGANLFASNSEQKSVMEYAILSGNPRLVAAMVAKGYPVNKAVDDQGTTPLHIAASFKKGEVLSELLKLGADVNVKDKSGATPLWKASVALHGRDTQVVELLIKAGADVNVKNNDGLSLMQKMILHRRGDDLEDSYQIRVSDRLLSAGAKLSDTYPTSAKGLDHLHGKTTLEAARYIHSDNPGMMAVIEQFATRS